MNSNLPEYYFRVRENGAFVFRVSTANQHQRIEMEQIATVNTRNGEIKAHGERVLSDTDLSVVGEWLAGRMRLLARRDVDDIHRAIDHMNMTAHWANSRATDEQLEDITDKLLLAMHDLRSVLVRKKSDRLLKKD